MRTEIADKIADRIREIDKPLTAATIAGDFLKLNNTSGPAVNLLVRGILANDGRFHENGNGDWSLEQQKQTQTLRSQVVVCRFEIPSGAASTPWLWHIQATCTGTLNEYLSHSGSGMSEQLSTILSWCATFPIATNRSGALTRWLGAQERIHAVPEIDPLIIDLTAWQRLLEPSDPGPASRGRSLHDLPVGNPQCPPGADDQHHGDNLPEADPQRGRSLLARPLALLEKLINEAPKRKLHSWADIAAVPSNNRTQASADLWNQNWDFTAADVAALPEVPGVYRFFDSDEQIQYIGKSTNLRRRVSDYFRPLGSNSSRRAMFLKTIHRLEVEPAGTELEALILESAQIRQQRPKWNVMVNLGAEESSFAFGEEEILFLVRRGDSGIFSMFALSGSRAATGKVDPNSDPDQLVNSFRQFYVEGTSGEELMELASPERVLVRRWLRGTRKANIEFPLMNFATYESLAQAIIRAANLQEDPATPAGKAIIQE